MWQKSYKTRVAYESVAYKNSCSAQTENEPSFDGPLDTGP